MTMLPLLAQAQADGLSFGVVVNAISGLATLGLTLLLLFRGLGTKSSERQVEPTEMHAIATELRAQTLTLNKLDREMGTVSATLSAMDDKIEGQAVQVDNAFKRINAISMESASVRDRFNDHLQEHREGKRHA